MLYAFDDNDDTMLRDNESYLYTSIITTLNKIYKLF